jgi:uncharacterized protein YycO
MCATMSTTTTFGQGIDYYSTNENKLSIISGVSKEEIIEAKKDYGDDFNAMFEDYIKNKRVVSDNATDSPTEIIFADAETNTEFVPIPGTRISNDHWTFMKEKFKKGQILVTDDAATATVDHGHAAILVSTTHTVEHLGKTTTSLSGYYDVGWWQSFDTMKSFNYSSTTVMSNAANYAKNNLQDWKYNAFSNRTSTYTVNCATLVWKAYNSEGVNIVDSTSGGVYPVDFDKSTKISWVRSVGWNNVNW